MILNILPVTYRINIIHAPLFEVDASPRLKTQSRINTFELAIKESSGAATATKPTLDGELTD